MTGELAEFEASERLGLQLTDARSPGCDAVSAEGRRIQIKGRRVKNPRRVTGRVPSIKLDEEFDSVVLVLFDDAFQVAEIWEAQRGAVERWLDEPGSKSRNERRSLAITQFKSIAARVWPTEGIAA